MDKLLIILFLLVILSTPLVSNTNILSNNNTIKNCEPEKTTVYIPYEEKTDFKTYYNVIRKYSKYISTDLSIYLKNQCPYCWNYEIEKTANDLKSEYVEDTVYNILKWVRENIVYIDDNKGDAVDAKEVFKRGFGVCKEYSILAVAMLRSAGIYSREVSGNGHSWIEILYPVRALNQTYVTWIPVEPQSGSLSFGEFVYSKPDESQTPNRFVLCKRDCWMCIDYDCIVYYNVVKVERDEDTLKVSVTPSLYHKASTGSH